MNGAFYIAATGMRAQQSALEVAANNIANINTAGFKRSRAQFSELLAPPPAATDRPAVQGEGLAGVLLGRPTRVFDQGDVKATGATLDLAIQGEGFLELLAPGGEIALWRGGRLSVTDEGLLAGGDGLPLRAMISVPTEAHDLKIAADGRVTAQLGTAGPVSELGRIDLVMIDAPERLKARGEGLYDLDGPARTTAPGEDGAGLLAQGAIETSNVQLSEEMVGLLLTQRAYAANAQLLQVGDQLMAIANGLKR